MNKVKRKGLVVGVSAAAIVAGALSTSAAFAQSDRSTLTGSVPAWATSANFKGAATSSDYVGFRVYLGWTNPAGAESLAQAVSDPKSAAYGHYLTPAQFRQ